MPDRVVQNRIVAATLFASLIGCAPFAGDSADSPPDAHPDGPTGDGPTGDAAAPLADGAGPDGAPRVRVIFVTTGSTHGDMRFGEPVSPGRGAADSRCAAEAAAAMLPGTFIAWLSQDAEGAILRLTDGPPWSLPGVGVAFPSVDHIKSATPPLVPINRDARGQALDMPLTAHVFTGTRSDGQPVAGSTCVNWTVDTDTQPATGGSPSSASAWTSSDIFACNDSFHVICFEK